MKELTKISAAKKGIKIIMTGLNASRQEALNMLYVEWVNKRAKKVPHSRLLSYANNHPKLFVYAAQSVKQKHFRDLKRETEKSKNSTILAEGGMSSEEKESLTKRAIKVLPAIFKNVVTRNFVKYVFKSGKEETKKKFKLTNKQFSRKIRDIEKLCVKNRQQINQILNFSGNQNEINILNEFINEIESENYSEDKFQELINKHYEYIDDLAGQIPMIYSPLLLVNDWKIACLKDKYKLINKIYSRKKELEN